MDRIVTYKYAAGTVDELREIDYEKIDVRDNLDSARKNLDSLSEGIIAIPRFVGAYQERGFVTHTNSDDEKQAAELCECITGLLGGMVDEASKKVIKSRTGFKDRAHPKLIHVGYDGRFYTPNIVRMSFGDEINRLGYSKLEDMPDFSGKDTESLYLAIKSALKLIHGEEDEEIRDDLKKALQSVRNNTRDYGLTREEYVLLMAAEKMHSGPSKLVTEPGAVNAGIKIAELIREFFK